MTINIDNIAFAYKFSMISTKLAASLEWFSASLTRAKKKNIKNVQLKAKNDSFSDKLAASLTGNDIFFR